MKWVFQPTLLCQMCLSLQRLTAGAAETTAALGLGLTGLKPFPRRIDRARLTLQLAHAEALLRRLLLLEAARFGPLEIPARKMPEAHSPPTGAAPARAPRDPCPPAFRLFESVGRQAPPATRPPPPRAIPGPRILYLDAPLPPPEPGECPARADDRVPAGRLIARFHALRLAANAPAPLICTLRRKMAHTGRRMLAPLASKALSSRLAHDERVALQQIDGDAAIIDAALNTS